MLESHRSAILLTGLYVKQKKKESRGFRKNTHPQESLVYVRHTNSLVVFMKTLLSLSLSLFVVSFI